MINIKKPKCPNCGNCMVKIFRRIGSKRENLGLICPFCNGYNIFKKPNEDGPVPRKIGPIFIGLRKICS